MENRRILNRNKVALLVIDIQKNLMPLIFSNEQIKENIKKLIQFGTIVNIPVILTAHYPKGLGPIYEDIQQLLSNVQPVEKITFSCFRSKGFQEKINGMEIDTLIVTGIETHICVSQTVLDGLDSYRMCVISDAVSSRTEENRRIGLKRMRENGAIISSTEMVIYEILGKAGTAEFKKALPLVK
jgi:nicotinamidase-related amidase